MNIKRFKCLFGFHDYCVVSANDYVERFFGDEEQGVVVTKICKVCRKIKADKLPGASLTEEELERLKKMTCEEKK